MLPANLDAFGDSLILQGRTRKATSTRKSSLLRIEHDFNINMDILVRSVEDTQRLRKTIYDHHGYSECQRKNFPNAVKKYFEFINGTELPRLHKTSCPASKKSRAAYCKMFHFVN